VSPLTPVKVLWHKTQYGWKGEGNYRRYECKHIKKDHWEMQIVTAAGELADTWRGRSLKQCKHKAFLIEQEIRAIRISIANNIMRAILDD
jgi:hypothetical protein